MIFLANDHSGNYLTVYTSAGRAIKPSHFGGAVCVSSIKLR
jgi:hypothetical protein